MSEHAHDAGSRCFHLADMLDWGNGWSAGFEDQARSLYRCHRCHHIPDVVFVDLW